VGLHDLGDHFVLLGELLLEVREFLLELALLGLGVTFEGSGAALEELLLPAVEEVWIQPLLIAEVGDGDCLQQVPAEDVKFLLRREPPSRGHGHLPGSVNILTAAPKMSISV